MNQDVLKPFYKNVRPWGFWKPVYEKVIAQDPEFKANKNFGRDMFNIAIGIIWQTALVVLPIYFILSDMIPLFITVGITIITSIVLKKTWFDKLSKDSST